MTMEPTGRRQENLPVPSPPEAAQDLLVRFRSGDRQAFDEIVGAFQGRLVQFFYRLCWDLGRSEDLTQNLFLKLLKGARSYRPEGKLATFIFRIATNLWIDHYRSMRPRQRLYSLDQALMTGKEPPGAVTDVTPAQIAEEDEERRQLRGGLQHLTEPHRLVFELAVYQELPYAEIGEVLQIPVGTVKSRMHNSVKALKSLLAESGEGGERRPFRSGAGAAG